MKNLFSFKVDIEKSNCEMVDYDLIFYLLNTLLDFFKSPSKKAHKTFRLSFRVQMFLCKAVTSFK